MNKTEILFQHQKVSMGLTSGSADTCKCGKRIYADDSAGEIDERRDLAFAKHQAEALTSEGLLLEDEEFVGCPYDCDVCRDDDDDDDLR